MRTLLAHLDLYMSKLGGPPGVLYFIITTAQIRTYGWRHWAKWGFGTGVLKDGFEALERETIEKVREAERDLESIEGRTRRTTIPVPEVDE